MSTLDILVLNQYYPPDTSATAEVFSDIVDALSAAGHHVTVVAGRPSYRPGQRESWRPLRRRSHDLVNVVRVGSTSLNRDRIGLRAINYLSFLLFAMAYGLLRRRPDVVIVGSDPPFAVWAGLMAGRGRPVVYYLQDLHPEFAIASKMIGVGVITQIWEAVHTFALRRVQMVICLGEVMAKRVQIKGVVEERIIVLPTGAWPAAGIPEASAIDEIRQGASIVALHAGNLGGAGTWDTFVKASQILEKGAEIVFVGDGFKAASIAESGLRLIPFHPVEKLASVMAAGDLQIVTLRPGMEGLVVPSKLFNILAHGRPVLAVVPEQSEVARIVREWQCGFLVDPDDPEGVADKIRFASRHPERLDQMSRRAREAGKHFDRGRLLREFVRHVEQTPSKRLT